MTTNSQPPTDPQPDPDWLGRILVWCAIALMCVVTFPQMLGELLASPLERHRDKSNTLWVAWNFLRLLPALAIIVLSLYWLLANGLISGRRPRP